MSDPAAVEEQFVLNVTTLAAIGGIMGVLTGAISVLFKSLINSKDKQIEELKANAERTEKTMRREAEYWRSFSVHLLEPAEQARLEKLYPSYKPKDDEED